MSANKFPWDKPEGSNNDVKHFIKSFKKHLEPNQIELLKHFNKKIYGFHLYEHNGLASSDNPHKLNHEATFKFEHLGVKGEIKIQF